MRFTKTYIGTNGLQKVAVYLEIVYLQVFILKVLTFARKSVFFNFEIYAKPLVEDQEL